MGKYKQIFRKIALGNISLMVGLALMPVAKGCGSQPSTSRSSPQNKIFYPLPWRSVPISTCKICHGQNFEKKALGQSRIVRDLSPDDIIRVLRTYKSEGVLKNNSQKVQLRNTMWQYVANMPDSEIIKIANQYGKGVMSTYSAPTTPLKSKPIKKELSQAEKLAQAKKLKEEQEKEKFTKLYKQEKLSSMSPKEREIYYATKLKESLALKDSKSTLKYCKFIEYEKIKVPHSFYFIYGKAAFEEKEFELAKKMLSTYTNNSEKTTKSYLDKAYKMLLNISNGVQK